MTHIGAVVSLVGCALFGAAVGVNAQSTPAVPAPSPDPRQVNVTVFRGSAAAGQVTGLSDPGGNVDFVTMPLAVGGELVTQSPYSAEAVTDVVQTLADGNRIVRQSKVALFRDGKGRTRREQGLAVLGNFVSGGDAERTMIQIHDPETGTMYLLDTRRRQARRLPAPKVRLSWQQGPDAPFFESVQVDGLGDGQRAAIMRRYGATPAMRADDRTEQLGRRNIEGVDADGTRTTVIIPAGQIGNEQPINIVSERWYSPELKTLVMSRHSDPRFGETTYRLTNIVRAEPSPDLFAVPGDYQVIDSKEQIRNRLRRKPQ